jgi:LPXTG-motif cell wall-anchored protein
VLDATATNTSGGTATIDTGVEGETDQQQPTTPPAEQPTVDEARLTSPPASVEAAQVEAAVQVRGTLPYTGSDHTRDATAAGLLLVLAGWALERRSRRRAVR